MQRHAVGLAAILLFCCGITSAADWPRFRGPNGTGIANDKNIPVRFTEKNFLWKLDVPGRGYSSPIVSKGKIFLQSSSPDQSQRFLVCVDAKKGEIEWSKPVPGGLAKTHVKNTPASNTPAADGERIYAVFWDGTNQSLTAWDYKGELLWDRDLGPFKSQHGSGMSPMVVGDKVVVNNDQDGAAELQVFEAKTGKPAWSKKRDPVRACYSTPFLLEKTDSGPELIVASTAGITAYDPANGNEIWNFIWKFDNARLRNVGSPIYHQGMIFAVSGDGDGSRHMIAVKAGGKGDVSSTNLVWEKKRETSYVPTILAKDGLLFWLWDSKNIAICVDAKTGQEKFREELKGGAVSASPIMIDGKIYSITEKGIVNVFKASSTYQQLGMTDLKESVFATPAVADDRLYIRGEKHLFCIGNAK